MFAVIESLGRQYKVAVGDVIRVDRISHNGQDCDEGSKVIFTQVVMLGGEAASVGKPYIDGASVAGELIANRKDEKVVSFKKKRRKGYHKKKGFRRQFTEVRITDIKAA